MSIHFKFVSDEALDADDDTVVGTTLELDRTRNVFISVEAASGAHTSHVVTIQMSVDATTWHDSALTVTGLGFKEGTVNARYCRAAVTTEEGGASTVNVRINAK